MTPFDHDTAVCGVAAELAELQFTLDDIDDIDMTTTCAPVEAKDGSGLQFDTDSSENEIAACVDFFFGASNSDLLDSNGTTIEVPRAIREPFAFGDSPSAVELSRRDSIIALYKTQVRAAGSASQIPRPPARNRHLDGHALCAWRKLYNLQVKTESQRRRRLLKRKRDSAAASRSPLDSFLEPYNVRAVRTSHSAALRAVHAALTSSLRASLSLAGVTSASAVHPKSLDADARLPAGIAAGVRPQLATPSVPFLRPLVECDSPRSVPLSHRVHSRAPLKMVRVVARDGGVGGVKGRRARLDFGKQLAQRTTHRDRHKKSHSSQPALAAAVKDIDGSSKNGGSPWQLQKRLSSFEKSAINEVHPQQWIVDSGASHHLTKERPSGQLRPFRKQVSGVGGTVDITGLGTYGRLTDVRYAPGQSLNLCSVRQLIETTDINTVVFTRDHAIAMGGTTRSNRFTIKIGRRVGRLYYLTRAAFNDDSNQGDTAAPAVQTEARPPVLHEPDPSDKQTTSATTSPGTSISVAGNPDDHIDQQQLSRAVPLSSVGMPEGHQSLPKTPMRSRGDTSLTSQNTPTPLPITGQDVGSLDIDANESDNTRDERGNGTRRYETSFSTASEGLLARAKVLSTGADDGNWANDGKKPMSTTVRQVKLLPGGADDGNWANDGKQPMSTTVTQLYVPCRKKSKKHQVIDRWHQRLFHAAPKRLKQLAAAGLLPGVIPEDFKGYSTDTCEACLYGKMSKRPVPNKSRSKVRATRPGELIHCDIFGPSRVATISGRHRYFITFIDDFSGRLWLYLLKGRSDAAIALRRFAEDFQVATRGLRAMYYVIGSYVPGVQRIRTDNAGELVGDKSPFALYLKNAKIQHEYSCPHMYINRMELQSVRIARLHMWYPNGLGAGKPPDYFLGVCSEGSCGRHEPQPTEDEPLQQDPNANVAERRRGTSDYRHATGIWLPRLEPPRQRTTSQWRQALSPE